MKIIDFLSDVFWTVIAFWIIFTLLTIGVGAELVKWIKDIAGDIKNFMNYLREME